MNVLKNSLVAAILFFVTPVFAQYTTVTVDFEKAYFNDNQALPAEVRMLLTGSAPDQVTMVEAEFFTAKEKPIYSNIWRRSADGGADMYQLPINYKLRGSTKYDARISYFKATTAAERTELESQIMQRLEAYLENNLEQSKKRVDIEFNKRPKRLISDMDDLVYAALERYRPSVLGGFEGFSELIELRLEGIQKAALVTAMDPKKDKEARTENAQSRKLELIQELKDLIRGEVTMATKDLAILTDMRYIDDYETERKQGSFSVNAGYGGVYLSGDLNEDLTYGAAPYVGLSFPLGNSAFAPKVLSNSSLTIGAFLENFEDENGREVSGPIFNRPIYVGLDYKVFQFIRFNVGASVLEGMKTETGSADLTNYVYVRPFVGLSAKIDLSIGLDR